MIQRKCWCGSIQTTKFSEEYSKCLDCGTLVSQVGLGHDEIEVKDDDVDFYGKQYALTHQTKNYGFPDIYQRSKMDLAERCTHWLQTLLKYKLPPAKTLELGCAHGGFVGLQSFIGYEAQGLELSHWVVQFAQKTFGIKMLEGPIEKQNIQKNTYDVIALMDVLEHLSEPTATMRTCLDLLKEDGILIIQTPCCPQDLSYEDMGAQKSPFLDQLKAKEHLYLLTQEGIKKFFGKLGTEFIAFEPAIFSFYDMFLVVGRQPLKPHTDEEIQSCLSSTLHGRIIEGLIDLKRDRDGLASSLHSSQASLAAKTELIKELLNKQGFGKYKYLAARLCKRALRKLRNGTRFSHS